MLSSMSVYEFNLNECKLILNRNICLTDVSPTGTFVTFTIDGAIYNAYKGVDGYVAGIYITVDTVDTINNTAAVYIAECPRGYKSVNGNCVKVIYTPIGELTEGELYFYGIIAIPLLLFGLNLASGIATELIRKK